MKYLLYSNLAPFYDQINCDRDYKRQSKYLFTIFKKFCQTKNNILLDLGCGTGKHLRYFFSYGYNAIGIDNSCEMLNEAGSKYPELRFFCQDIQKFNVEQSAGIIVCLFNTILYITKLVDLQHFFERVYNQLDQGGLFVFDMVDRSIATQKPETYWRLEKNTLTADFRCTVTNKEYHEKHIMGAYSVTDIKQALRALQFEVWVLKQEYDKIIPATNDPEVVIVCRK